MTTTPHRCNSIQCARCFPSLVPADDDTEAGEREVFRFPNQVLMTRAELGLPPIDKVERSVAPDANETGDGCRELTCPQHGPANRAALVATPDADDTPPTAGGEVEDIEFLTAELLNAGFEWDGGDDLPARAVLASDWLKAHDAARDAEVGERIAQAVTEHVEHMRGYTIPALDSSWLEGYEHALHLFARDAGFIAHRATTTTREQSRS